ncbi:MAG: D-glycero-beta-D-manno-heptose 1-phosphate adenylyltransferase [Nitrospirae bacterium]|nr:D-glycero-beta-D-manno-heptose 1-phosphate adenylyltransferase [Nitrospirota bacterium]MBF0535389.1 D-glycero-beta-D-manno-heptose 1-phosphate adenylyltransferase [Nitrospirota bacterium]MBF0616909.1 D-glycero-beta-D-manno-heptose 1-phosphate adenylyltransferase [Nitrospirota bacterium]
MAPEFKDKVLGLLELKSRINALKTDGKKIVFTNGCFDIIHVGHTRYLTMAKSLGDILIVAVNSDDSVSRLKPGRPIVSEYERAEVLASLSMVDYVVIFNEDTPYETICELCPDVLVKGGDWKKQDIVGADIVPEVHSLPFVDGRSTTEIINKILRICS